MPDELVPDVSADSSQPDGTSAPSAEPGQLGELSEPTPPSPSQVPPVEEAKIPLSRLNEVIEQRKAAEAREARVLEILQRVQQPSQPAQPQVSFWEGRVNHPDERTAIYWQQQKQMFDLAKQEARQEVMAEIQPAWQAGMAQLAAINIKAFRQENPDIKPGSEEERQVVAYMEGRMDGLRHPLESAKRNVLYDVLQRKVSQQSTSQTQRQAAQKRQASPEAGPGIPATAGGPHAKGSYRETLDAELKAEGL